ncbi:MAG: DEAD/DEAH box helicase [Muribaculaceae bacterium]
MKLSEITSNIRERLGIAELNPMQRRMTETVARSIVLLSPTGSGKTLAFAIPLLRRLRPADGRVQAVVIAPSRELVLQIYEVIRPLAVGYKTVAFYGGHSMMEEKRSLSAVPDIVIATPGRLLDHINRHQIDLYPARTLVLDEYDKSLELGFHDEMKRIVARMPNLSQTLLTSATRLDALPSWLHAVEPATVDFLNDGGDLKKRLTIIDVESPVKDKIDTLADLLRSLDNQRVIIFVNYRDSAQRLYDHLRRLGLPVGLYHGALDQADREKAIDLLNNGTTPILISTDLGARGLDIDTVGSVIHYHMPLTPEAWTHRNGRTARVDREGTVYVVRSESDTVPEFATFDRPYHPTGHSDDPIRPAAATLYFDAGKKEKLSRGDILGFLVNKGGLRADEIGKITVKDHSAIAAIPPTDPAAVIARIKGEKIKGKRVRVSLLK